MNVQDYLKYSAKITPDGKFYMMAKAVIYDYIEGLVEFKKRIPEPQVVDDGIMLCRPIIIPVARKLTL